MAIIHDLIDKIEDEALRNRISKEVDKLSKQKKFGLVFEEHLPECTPLYDIPVKKGSKVALRSGKVSDFFTVLKIEKGIALCLNKDKTETTEYGIDELVCVAEFGEPIYPYLKPIDSVCNAPDNDLWHTLIEADNYHALQLLEYLYAGKVDCIYIDPPYNTGARDWKYNNDYVDSTDQYRHSKWLSMMQRRLGIAKRLLNPKESVLIVTIDEKEYLHLGCLLEEMFPEANIQMITSVISGKGVSLVGQFSRVEEYIFIVTLGSMAVTQQRSNMLNDIEEDEDEEVEVEFIGLRRRNTSNYRTSRPNQFYPFFVDEEDGHIIKIGDAIKADIDRDTVPVPDGCVAIWPLDPEGRERIWGLIPDSSRQLLELGCLKVGSWNKNKKTGTIKYWASGNVDKLRNGEIEVKERDKYGAIVKAIYKDKNTLTIRPRKVWNMKTHNASTYGTLLLRSILVDKRFSFPKSLYAVTDTLRFFVSNKPNALIVDFFAGSGTTLHAVNLLNAEDGGHRRCILVTNNEVSEEEAKEMSAKGLKPGDDNWETLGIAHHVTWPRTVCSIKGHDVNGNPLKGNYLGIDIPMEDGFKTNAAFFKLGFLDKTKVALRMQFKELLPILWMKAGAIGPCPKADSEVPDMLILTENKMAVLNDENCFATFSEKINERPEIKTVFLVTDYENSFVSMTQNLPGRQTYQLYRDYLDNFRINTGRNSR